MQFYLHTTIAGRSLAVGCQESLRPEDSPEEVPFRFPVTDFYVPNSQHVSTLFQVMTGSLVVLKLHTFPANLSSWMLSYGIATPL